MLFDTQSLLLSVARHAVLRAAAQTPPLVLTLGTNWFVNQASQQPGVEPYGVLRLFGGSADPTNPRATANVQLSVTGRGNVAAHRMAQAAYEAIALDDAGVEARMVRLPAYSPDRPAGDPAGAWMVTAFTTIGRPGQVGRNESDKVTVAANVSLGFYPLPPSPPGD